MREEVDLRLIDVAGKLDIECAEPPVPRQLEGEIAARLLGAAAADHLAVAPRGPLVGAAPPAEYAEKAPQPVIPVVIARDRVEVGSLGRRPFLGKRAMSGVEGRDESFPVCFAARRRIDL